MINKNQHVLKDAFMFPFLFLSSSSSSSLSSKGVSWKDNGVGELGAPTVLTPWVGDGKVCGVGLRGERAGNQTQGTI